MSSTDMTIGEVIIMSKITIIGAGNVGSTIAYTLASNGGASEIVMIDINEGKALGEALDIKQGLPFCNPCFVYAGTYEDAVGSDIVIITSGLQRKATQTRLDLAQVNIDILKDITPQITKYAPNAYYIIVSNPVDILTYTFAKCSGIPEHRIIGSGTILDTSRLRARLSEYYYVNQQNVHAYVFGEHGDSSFIPWSLVNISNIPIDHYHRSVSEKRTTVPNLNHEEIEDFVRKSGSYIIERKNSTFYAITLAVCYIVRTLHNAIDTTLTVSTMMHGQYGIDDVCLSVLCAVNKDGIKDTLNVPLTDDELAKLRASAARLKETIASVKI